jgi:hypothetical protein
MRRKESNAGDDGSWLTALCSVPLPVLRKALNGPSRRRRKRRGPGVPQVKVESPAPAMVEPVATIQPVASGVPPLPERYSATPVAGDASRFFLHPRRTGFWVVSPERGRWVLYAVASKEPVGWEDVTESQRGRTVRAFQP